MKIVPKMQRIVEAIARKYSFDLTTIGPSLRLYLPGHDYLVIENLGNDRVGVANYIEHGNLLLPDPWVVFYTRYCWSIVPQGNNPRWVPLEATDVFNGWHLYADVNRTGEVLRLYDPHGQARLAEQCEQVFSHHIALAGWTEQAIQVEVPRCVRSSEDFSSEGWEGLLSFNEVDHAQSQSSS